VSLPRRRSPALPALLGAGLLLGACGRCGDRPAGVPLARQADAGTHRALPGIDLRSALILIHPEFRFARVSGERAGIERQVAFPDDRPLLPALEEGLSAKKFENVREEDGVVRADAPPLQFEARRRGRGVVTVALYLPLDDDSVRKLLHSPSPMGSEHLSARAPSPEGGRRLREAFVMHLRYGARPDHASFLVRRLVEGLLQTRWEVQDGPPPRWPSASEDGGLDTVPHHLDLTLEQVETGGRLEVERRVGRVRLRYVQPLRQ
jgi:hypothetical protein